MSNLTQLAADLSRELASADVNLSVTVTDATGSQVLTGGPAVRPSRVVNAKRWFAQFSRTMATAHPGATITVTFGDTGAVRIFNAPGGAFDGRAATPAAVEPADPKSTSADVRVLTPGVALADPPRALFIAGAGVLEIRTVGTPGEFQPAFAVPAGLTLPVRVVEIGAGTTAGPVLGLY